MLDLPQLLAGDAFSAFGTMMRGLALKNDDEGRWVARTRRYSLLGAWRLDRCGLDERHQMVLRSSNGIFSFACNLSY